MDKNRQILITILIFMTLTLVVSIVKISLTMTEQKEISFNINPNAPGVGVVTLYGAITTVSSNGFTSVKGSDEVVAQLGRYSDDPKIRAIVLRINSPGGTVGATQEIFRKVMEIRQRNIPVVASMSDMAASGGYYVASAANYIFANQGTVTGSIGVIVSSPSFQKLFEDLGIGMNVIKSGQYKDILSSSREITEEERALLQELVDVTYTQFLKDVSLGRNIPISDFREYADGRIFTGSQALGYHLVDEIGTYENALAKAKELAKLPSNAPIYTDKQNAIDQFFGALNSRLNTKLTIIPDIETSAFSVIEYRYQP